LGAAGSTQLIATVVLTLSVRSLSFAKQSKCLVSAKLNTAAASPPKPRWPINVAILVIYLSYVFGQALLYQRLQSDSWKAIIELWVWYSLSGVAMAVACWMALGDGSTAVRLATSLLVMIWAWIVWQASTYVAFVRQPGERGSTTEGFTVYAAGQAVYPLLITALGLTACRWMFGLRLVRTLNPPTPRTTFTLGELLAAMAIVAVTLGVARIVAPADTAYISSLGLDLGTAEYWTYIALAVLPAGFLIAFQPRHFAIGIAYYTAAIVAIVFRNKFEFVGRMPISQWWFFFHGEWLGNAVLLVHVVAFLALLRAQGYQLRWGVTKPTECQS
jgi:hypothetical protein